MANPASLTITDLTKNAALNQPAVQAIDTDGTVNCAAAGLMDRLILEVINLAATALTVTILAGTGDQALIPADLAVALAATGNATDKRIIGPFEAGRFMKADGSFDVSFAKASGSTNATVRIYRLPRNV
jgi:hypothetical protein